MTDPVEPHEDHPDLVALTRSELSNAEALDAGDHLSTCAACRADLAELVVGDSLLRRAAGVSRPVAPETAAAPAALPPLDLRHVRRDRGTRRLVLVAAAALVVGGVGGALVDRSRDVSTPGAAAPAPDRVVALDAVAPASDGSAPRGEVHMVTTDGDTALTVHTHDLPSAGAGEFYEAWLLDRATEKMLPLGVVTGAEATFRVDDALLGSYDAIDLSLESDDGDPQHSVTSVLRGSYDDATGG